MNLAHVIDTILAKHRIIVDIPQNGVYLVVERKNRAGSSCSGHYTISRFFHGF